MATRKGLEPSTSSVTGWHSNRLNYRATFYEIGGNNRARTCDPLLVRQMLSQLSYAPLLVSAASLDCLERGDEIYNTSMPRFCQRFFKTFLILFCMRVFFPAISEKKRHNNRGAPQAFSRCSAKCFSVINKLSFLCSVLLAAHDIYIKYLCQCICRFQKSGKEGFSACTDATCSSVLRMPYPYRLSVLP